MHWDHPTLEDAALEYLRTQGQEVRIREGGTIVRQGDPGEALWVILKGAVELRLRSAGTDVQPLARFSAGEIFGEVAILLDVPAPADVVAVAPTTVLRYPAELVPAALAECEPLRASLLAWLAHQVYRSALQAWRFHRRNQALTDLYQGGLPPEALVAVSARMRAVMSKIERAAAQREPVLVSGEAGTGKLLVARRIHAESQRHAEPLLAVDCRALVARDADMLLFGGGNERGSASSSDSFGALHLAHGGTLVLRGVEALEEETQRTLEQHLEIDDHAEEVPFPDVRLIATTLDGEDNDEGCGLVEPLRQRFASHISLPPLAERPRDIVPIAQSVLAREGDGDDGPLLTSSAERALVSLKYRHGNVAELASVVELAARCAEEGEIRAEHIFSGFADEKPIGLSLSRFWLVRWLVWGGGLRLVRLVTAAGFLVVAGLCLFAGSSAVGRVANTLVWSAWEPAVFAFFLLVGSLWCTVCPLSSMARLVQRVFSLRRPPPEWLLQAGGWLSAAGFVLILWSEQLFDMFSRPLPSGVLLLALIIAAVVCSMLWQREVWCRHLCPLGRLGVALAPVAPMAVAARASVCASYCTSHECYKGSATEPGCTVFHHPQQTNQGHHCKMCLTCLRSCPHGSTALYLRPRLRSAWRLISAESYVVPLALTVFFLAPVLVVAQGDWRLSEPLWLTLACVLSLVVAAACAPALPRLLQGREAAGSALPAQVACALVVLGWGPLMAFQMHHLPLLHSLTITADPQSVWAWWPGPQLSAVTLARVAFVIFAAILSAIILWNAQGRARQAGERFSLIGWWLIIGLCTVYTFGSLALVVYC